MPTAKRTGYASLPLHGGKAPAWLFSRMVRLSREILAHLVEAQGPGEVLRRLSDPYWFQAFGCVLGFDWHSSGVTTTVCGAIKESLRGPGVEWGLFAAGGKGGASRKSPLQIAAACEAIGRDPAPLVHASRTAAKVDSAAVQDGYQLYHHVFLFTSGGDWCVVQQGMNGETSTARRYHWLAERVTSFVEEPHEAVCCDRTGTTLNLVAAESADVRRTSVELAGRPPEETLRAVESVPELRLPVRHALLPELDVDTRYLSKILLSTYERAPGDFEALLGLDGVGPRTLRALALASELVYGSRASTRDPARFAFAHGGKDGIPFPVDRTAYRSHHRRAASGRGQGAGRSIGADRGAAAAGRLWLKAGRRKRSSPVSNRAGRRPARRWPEGVAARGAIAQVTPPCSRGQSLDRISQHRPRHLGGVPLEEALFRGAIPLAHLPQHPADRLVNQIVIVVQQDAGHRQGVAEVPVSDERVRGHDRDAPVPEQRRPCQAPQRRPRTPQQMAPHDLRRRQVHQVPVVDPARVAEVQVVDRAAAGLVRRRVPACEHDQRELALLMPRGSEQPPDRRKGEGIAASRHTADVGDAQPEEAVAFPGTARARS